MRMRKLKKKIYPSSLAFMDGRKVDTKYSSGCLRMVLAKAFGYREGDIDPIYQQLGAFNEMRFKAAQTALDHDKIEDEVPFKTEIDDKGTILSGRYDFLIWKKGSDEPEIHELKATMSKNTIYAARKGQVSGHYLSQIVCYMLEKNHTKAFLHITGYRKGKDEGTFVITSSRAKEIDDFTFEIEIRDDRIYTNGLPTSYLVSDLVAYILEVAKLLDSPTVLPERPLNAFEDWTSPCRWCSLKSVCDQVDLEESDVDSFVNKTLQE